MSPSVAAFSAVSPSHTAFPTIAPFPTVAAPIGSTDCRLTGSAMVLGLRRCSGPTIVVIIEEGKTIGWLNLNRGLLLLALLGPSTPSSTHPSRGTKLHTLCINLEI